MCITNTTTCTAFETFATQRAWTLPAGDGAKTVTVFLRDTKGNTTTSTTSPRVALRLDTIAPSNGSMTAVAGTSTVALSWAGFADAGSGIARYRLATAAGATAPSTCATVAWEGTTTAINHVGLIGGTTYSYRVCAVDAAGNVSSGTVATATPHELDPPVGSLKINAGATLSKSRTVSLALTATDASGVTQMCISATTTCTAWVTPAATMTYTFPADGAQTLRAWFRDRWGTTSAPATATIVVDTVAPTSPALSTTAALGRITLGWTAATDATSGLASYKLVGANGTTAPASCAVGTVIYAGTARTFAHTVAAKATWSYRVCATDVAGNTSTGTTRTITAR